MDEMSDSLVQNLLTSCWALERQRLIEDKQNLLSENIQLRADLLNLQRDHVALLQLVSVLQQQHQQYDGPTPLHSPLHGNYSALPSPSAQPSRYMQQQPQIARTSNTPRQSPGRDSSPAVPLSRKSIPISSTKKPKLHSSIHRSIRLLLTPRKSWSKGFSSNSTPETFTAAADGSYSSFPSSSSSKVIIDVAALTGLARRSRDFGIAGSQQQQQQYMSPRMDSVSSSNASSMKAHGLISRSYDSLTTSSSSHKPTIVTRHKEAGTSSSNSSQYRSSSPGLHSGCVADSINGDCINNSSCGSKTPRGWRQNRPPPLTALYTAPAAMHFTAAPAAAGSSPAKPAGLPLPPIASKAYSSSTGSNSSAAATGGYNSSIRYFQQQQHQAPQDDQTRPNTPGREQHKPSSMQDSGTVGLSPEQGKGIDCLKSYELADGSWSETPTPVRCVTTSSSTVDDGSSGSTPSNSSSEREVLKGGKDDDRAAAHDSSSSNRIVEGWMTAGNGGAGVEAAAVAAAADEDVANVLVREDTARLLSKMSLDGNDASPAAIAAAAVKAYGSTAGGTNSSNNSSNSGRSSPSNGYVLYGRPASRTQMYRYPGSPVSPAAAAAAVIAPSPAGEA